MMQHSVGGIRVLDHSHSRNPHRMATEVDWRYMASTIQSLPPSSPRCIAGSPDCYRGIVLFTELLFLHSTNMNHSEKDRFVRWLQWLKSELTWP